MVDFEPRPALMSPIDDQPRMSPPNVVMMRLWPSRMLPCENRPILPPPLVITPDVDGGASPSMPSTCLPPGVSIWMSPPKFVCT
ncbi:hypothetical protein D3C72_1904620 [compost metagenome]